MKISASEKIANHFGADKDDFQHRHGAGWYYKGQDGVYRKIGASFFDLQCSANWALKKLPGRDTF